MFGEVAGLKCPYCGSIFTGNPEYCPNCRQPLSRAGRLVEDEQIASNEREDLSVLPRSQRGAVIFVFILFALLVVFGITRLFYWIGSYQITRLYSRGELTPTIHQTTMSDMRAAHTIVFYGKDGDQIFLPELSESIIISGGVARITIPDSDWFSGDVEDIESAQVRLTPVLITQKGVRTQLPAMDMEIEVPVSPLKIITPEGGKANVVMSGYRLVLQVVPGSTVIINSEDVSDFVQRDGQLSQNVNVYPIGDNIFTVVVRTPQHHETRQDIDVYRQQYEIEVELSSSVSSTTQNKSTAIKGTIEQGATLTVETPYLEDSLVVDPETGNFSFIASLELGDNVVRFRVSKPGREDAVVSTTITYNPPRATYMDAAWAMDYDNLKRLYEQWTGKIFLCKGTIVNVYNEDGIEWLVMNVDGDSVAQQLVILENRAGLPIEVGRRYRAYADVIGRRMYKDQYFPCLTARYIYSDDDS